MNPQLPTPDSKRKTTATCRDMRPLGVWSLELGVLVAATFFPAFTGCRAGGPTNTPPEPDTKRPITASAGTIDSRDDVDPYIGSRVTVVGRLGSVKGVHATVTTPHGLVVGLPHFDLAGHGTAWFEDLDRTVEVTGILHAPHPAVPGGIPDFEGPTLEAESFRRVE